MNPLSAIYYCKRNLRKVCIVILMICLTGMLYVGGSYLTNIELEHLKARGLYNDFTFVFETNEDENRRQLLAFREEANGDERFHCMAVGANDYYFPTTLGFRNGSTSWSFALSDFLVANERLKLLDDTTGLKDNTLVLSEREAIHLGIKEGEQFDSNSEEALFYFGKRPYDVAMSKADGFYAVLIAEESKENTATMVTYSDKSDRATLMRWIKEMRLKYPALDFETGEERIAETKEAFVINRIIFLSILCVATCVFFITINAVLVGLYDERKREFQLYQKIGLPRKQIVKKIICELVLISMTGLVIGFFLSMGVITLLNEIYYLPKGLRLRYFHGWSIWSMLGCNAMILFPSILLRLRFLKRIRRDDL